MRGLGGPSRVAQRRALLERAPGVYALFQSATFPFVVSAPVLLLNAHRSSADVAPEARVPILYGLYGTCSASFPGALPQKSPTPASDAAEGGAAGEVLVEGPSWSLWACAWAMTVVWAALLGFSARGPRVLAPVGKKLGVSPPQYLSFCQLAVGAAKWIFLVLAWGVLMHLVTAPKVARGSMQGLQWWVFPVIAAALAAVGVWSYVALSIVLRRSKAHGKAE